MDGWNKSTAAPPRYTVPFFGAYVFYYAGYCVFSCFIVLYLTQQGYSATLSGLITSLSLLANLLMEPVGGYITDTFLSTRRYLGVCIVLIVGLCLFCTYSTAQPVLCMAALVLTAGLAYPFSQLMDAWVTCSRDLDTGLVFSRIRAGGSIGFALTSMAAGYYFRHFGWDSFFLVQAGLFLVVLPFLLFLPSVALGNHRRASQEAQLSIVRCFQVALGNPRYCLSLLLCTLYYFGHRPVGSYLSLLVEARNGDPGTFGMICGIGAAVEFVTLLVLSRRRRGTALPLWLCMTIALAANLLRPLCLWLLPGIWPVYLGQILQSVSFALFLSASVECFVQTADSRIRSFSISMGLTCSSVVGTIFANLLGGFLCDRWGVDALIWLSLLVCITNVALLTRCFGQLFPKKHPLDVD